MKQFPVVLRGYDKDKVDAAFASAQKTLADMREQIASNDDMILQLQAQLEQEKARQSKSGSSFSSLGANAQQMLSSAEQTSAELLELLQRIARGRDPKRAVIIITSDDAVAEAAQKVYDLTD